MGRYQSDRRSGLLWIVQSVYAHFGISLPRTTWDMENVGVAVSYEQALPGDIVLYDGHVGLYMGDGTIVNAMKRS